MKKAIYVISLTLPVIYLIYCLLNIEGWVKSHLGYEGYAVMPIIVAVIIAIVLSVIKIFRSVPNKVFYIPLVFVIVGVVIFVVGACIPCCSGG